MSLGLVRDGSRPDAARFDRPLGRSLGRADCTFRSCAIFGQWAASGQQYNLGPGPSGNLNYSFKYLTVTEELDFTQAFLSILSCTTREQSSPMQAAADLESPESASK